MKKILSFILAMLTLYFNAGLAFALEIPAGTSVPVMLTNSVNSDSLNDGDVVAITVTDDVYVGDKKVFTKGTQGIAYVEKATHTAHHGGAGMIRVRDGQLVDVNHKKHKVQITMDATGKSKRPSSIFLSIIGVLVILIPFGCWRYGEPATISQSQVFNAVIPSGFDL